MTRELAAAGRHSPGAIAEDGDNMEAACVSRVTAGEAEAFAPLVARYLPRILTHLVRMTHNRHEAEDLAQETFIRAFRFIAQYDTAKPLRNWLYAIATNLGRNALRARRRWAGSVSLDDDGPEGAGPIEVAGDDGRDMARQLDLSGLAAEALQRLTSRDAALMHMHYMEGFGLAEAGEMLGMTENAAKVAVCRARKRLREWLVEEMNA